MITISMWEDRDLFFGKEILSEILKCTFFSIFTIPLDIILLPLEIISFIIYKILDR